uniref:Uncharacterized protein n=1 Tax=Glossina morsitans morsitans TaxID=37546 RepID=A0A1B0G7A9_GLOMM
MWPSYWLYRGLDWGYRRQYVHLPVYIHRTYLQAKIIQYGIISLGLLNANSPKALEYLSAYFFRKKEYRKPNLGEDLRQVVQSKEFENNVKATAPFLVTGMLAWPLYWGYRGIGWHRYRNTEILPLYIRKTFYRAKAMELMILMTACFRDENRVQALTWFSVDLPNSYVVHGNDSVLLFTETRSTDPSKET